MRYIRRALLVLAIACAVAYGMSSTTAVTVSAVDSTVGASGEPSTLTQTAMQSSAVDPAKLLD